MTAKKWQAVVIGGSAGSVAALSQILSALPSTFPLPILVVIHLPSDKKSMLADLLQSKCALPVREAMDKEPLKGGGVYIAPPDYHLLAEANHEMSLSCDPPELFSRPSIDVLFESAADVYGASLIAIILSGANNDGARGLKMVAAEGGQALVQSPDEAYSQAMPIAALEDVPNSKILNAAQIGIFLKEITL